MSVLHTVEYVKDFVAVVVANGRRKAGREFHYAQRDRLGAGCAANLVPDTQGAVNNRQAFSHFRNAATASKRQGHKRSKRRVREGGRFCITCSLFADSTLASPIIL